MSILQVNLMYSCMAMHRMRGTVRGKISRLDRIASKSVCEQIRLLLRQPLSALSVSSCPIIFIIDALDELRNKGELAQLLELIMGFKCATPVKFILTSRPEMHIHRTPITNLEHTSILKLHTIDPVEVQYDIRRYILVTLAEVAKEATWYSSTDIDALVAASNSLFIFAATALKCILDPDDDDDRSARLRRATSIVAQGTAATAGLDTMYELVLTGASMSATIDADELDRLKSILACILTLRTSLTVQALADLMKLKPGILRSSLRRLHAVVNVPEDDSMLGLRTLHASFGDYLFSRAPARICIPSSLGHDTLAHACLEMMSSSLHFNFSQWCSSSYEPNPSTIPKSITLSLEYACMHWAHHVAGFVHSDSPAYIALALDAEIDRMFRPKLLFWLEVLSVLRKVGLAPSLLLIAGSAVCMSTLILCAC